MMAHPSNAPLYRPLSVISPQYITPEPLEILVFKFPGRNLVITDVDHNIMFKVKPCDTVFHCQLLLLDANDKPIVMLREKTLSIHSTWYVYKGESKSDSDMIFSSKSEHAMFQWETNLCVMLGNEIKSRDDCEFMIKGSWLEGNLNVYIGHSSTAIAQMHRPQSTKNAKSGEDKFMVTIQANTDYSFVVALFAIVNGIEEGKEATKRYHGAAKTSFDVVDLVGNLLSS